ncbi:hypothetical protein BX600DRAFT_292141 [Xylariales sp. PMI_506]|nr:hypothetical protein BX600DRAFT_292141 [Xylariales sp. PMI_506]
MASPAATEKVSPAGLTIDTTEFHSSQQDGTPLTPMSSCLTAEKTSKDLERTLSASPACSLHQANPFDTDVEAMGQSSENLNRKFTQFTGKSNMSANPNCTVWPGQAHWKKKARDAKRKNRSCQCMAGLSKRNRLIVKILIAILVIGIAVGVGLGISKPLGAGIWQSGKN